MDERVVPAVIVNNLPAHLSKNGEETSLALLGSKTGKELGVLFWRVHPSLAKFMVAFEKQEDRDQWHKSSPSLKKATAEFGLRSSMIWFNRESALVTKKPPTNKTSMTQSQLQGEFKSNSRMIFQDQFEDLDNIFGLFNTKVEDRDINRISPIEANDEVTEVSDQLIEENQVKNVSEESPLKANTSNQLQEDVGEFLMPMSDFLNFNKLPAGEILIPLTVSQLQEAIKFKPVCYVEDLDEDKMKVVYTIASEEGFKKENTMICDKSTYATELVQTLLNQVWIPPNLTGLNVTVEKYLKKKPENPIAAGQSFYQPASPPKQPTLDKLPNGLDDQEEAELTQSFSQFLSQNKKGKISKEETSFIMSRNGLNLLSLSKDFSAKPSHVHFEEQIQGKVNISGSLLQDFTNVLIEFFKSQSKFQTPEVKKDVVREPEQSSPPKQGKVSQILEKLRQLEGSITRKDFKKSKSLLPEVSGEVVKYARKVISAQTQKLQLGGAKSQQENQVKKLEQARSENRALSERNKTLGDETAAVSARQEVISKKMRILCAAVNNFSQDSKFRSILAEVNNNQDSDDNEELKALVEGLEKLQHSSSSHHKKSNLVVNLVLSDGLVVRFITNKYNNIGIRELERFLSKKVKSLEAPQLGGGGFREMKIVNGYVNCPTLGWGDRQYKVVTEAAPVHLGQGYSSRPGQRLGGVWGPRSVK